MKETWEDFDRRMGHRTYQASVPINRIGEWWKRVMAWGKGPGAGRPEKDEIDRLIDEAVDKINETVGDAE